MEAQELEIVVDRDGRVQVPVKGVKGGACTDLTRALEAALGDVEERRLTAEYHEQPVEVSGAVKSSTTW